MAGRANIRPLVIGGGATAVVLALAFTLFGGSSAKANVFATLDVVDQAVSVRPGATGAFHEGRTGESLRAGATVKTGSKGFASLTYFDGSLTRIGPSARYHLVRLEKPKGGKVIIGRLDVGETFHDVKKLSGSSSRFEVQTSHAVAAVRGTKFVARCVPPLPCGIAVIKGVVQVQSASGKKVLVHAGERITIDDTGVLSDLLLISIDDAWVNKNLQLDSGAATTTTTHVGSSTSGTSSSTTSTSTAGDAPASATTARPATTRPPATVATTATTRPTATTAATVGTTTTTVAPTTTTTAKPTTTTAKPTTTNPPSSEPTTTQASASFVPPPSDPGPLGRTGGPALPLRPLSVLALAGGVAWVRRHGDEWD